MPVSKGDSLPVFVVDNGGGSLKVGFANSKPDQESECRLIPNCITKAKSEKRRAFVGDQVLGTNAFWKVKVERFS